ncbi:Helicase conserved C-terminal domain-containing protein [Fibrobacter sp. UWCM]|uniref:DEAD/DEAH box helicase n=1 Tax=Fibrobacter sp. UWCM TaxID=1896208 RepID=UPI000919E1E6|nr:DEAD/DEAH box helicase [Fibrobacter sp. UWCM]SHH35138.1 Helicase conserved C-terminal domain-containing protein [Fibrobacter sp. UWCM]
MAEQNKATLKDFIARFTANPAGGHSAPASEDILEAFMEWAQSRGTTLYPAQEEAILELLDGKNVILNTPTGSGKSMVALALHFDSIAHGRKSVYTCPIKALVNEKWMALCKEFGPENVGLSTGDATVNRDAPILCCTAEILSNMALCEGEKLTITDIVMDEFHYYSDRERGVAWQIPLLTLPQSRFLLMSATVGATEFFEREMTKHTGRQSVTVRSSQRPVPLDFSYSTTEISTEVQKLVNEGKAPVYVVHFTQAAAASNAQNFMSLDLCTKEEKVKINEAIKEVRFSSPYGPDVKRWLKQGIGLHHAGLLPKYRILCEKLAQQGLLKVICGTDTLGVGVNVPIRTVLFTQLCKYSGDKTAILTARDFHQIAGRAGRKGFDNIGYVVAQAPEHVIENMKLEAKSRQTGKKFQKRKPPEHGYVPFDESTYRRLIDAQPEPLTSSFRVDHGMLLNILSRETDGCKAMRTLIKDCHESAASKKQLQHRSFQLFRSLVEKNIVEFVKPVAEGYSHLRVNMDLQDDFAMNQPLSLYLVDTLPKLDSNSPEYALDVITLCESIVENPEAILRIQQNKARTARLDELKAQGMEYNQRMEEIEKVEYPKPLREFIYGTYNEFAEQHPWVDVNVEPKSIVREMFENFSTFSGYVKQYGLQRMEAILLRHLNYVYKVLSQTVPDGYKNDELHEMEDYLGDMIRRTDSSLLEEWEKMAHPEDYQKRLEEGLTEDEAEKAFGADKAAADITYDKKRFLGMVRQRIFQIMGNLAKQDFAAVLDSLADDLEEGQMLVDGEGKPWTENTLTEIMAAYTAEHHKFRLDVEGRALAHTIVSYEGDVMHIQQMLQDEEEFNDWSIDFEINLADSREAGIPLLKMLRIGEA